MGSVMDATEFTRRRRARPSNEGAYNRPLPKRRCGAGDVPGYCATGGHSFTTREKSVVSVWTLPPGKTTLYS